MLKFITNISCSLAGHRKRICTRCTARGETYDGVSRSKTSDDMFRRQVVSGTITPPIQEETDLDYEDVTFDEGPSYWPQGTGFGEKKSYVKTVKRKQKDKGADEERNDFDDS